MSLIKIEHLRKEYPNVTPLKDVSVEINKGDVISVIGPSGTGKSTLLRCLTRLEEPTSGEVYFEGEKLDPKSTDIDRHRQKIGMVFQQFNVFPHLTVMFRQGKTQRFQRFRHARPAGETADKSIHFLCTVRHIHLP